MVRHIESCIESDMICDRGGNKAVVLGRLGSIIFRSEFYRHDILAQQHMTWMEAEEQGWKILTKTGKEPMTVKEVEHLLGNVEIV